MNVRREPNFPAIKLHFTRYTTDWQHPAAQTATLRVTISHGPTENCSDPSGKGWSAERKSAVFFCVLSQPRSLWQVQLNAKTPRSK